MVTNIEPMVAGKHRGRLTGLVMLFFVFPLTFLCIGLTSGAVN